VLEDNELIREKHGLLEITAEGRLFLSFIDWKKPLFKAQQSNPLKISKKPD